MKRIRSNETCVQADIVMIKSNDGSEYLGLLISKNDVSDGIEKLESLVGRRRAQLLDKNRMERDGSVHHLTVATPDEYKELSENQRDELLGQRVMVALSGLGSVRRGGAETYYKTARSPHAAYLRKEAGLKNTRLPRDAWFRSRRHLRFAEE